MKKNLLLLALLTITGCTVVSENRVFPKLSPFWSKDAQMQREYNRQHEARVKAYQDSLKTNALANP